MPRSGVIGNVDPYRFFGTFAGLPFWGGGLTLLAAAPGVGKTSWAGRMILEAASANIPAALVCYEHTAEELKFRLHQQALASIAGAHGEVPEEEIQKCLAKAANAVLEPANKNEDTARSIEERLINVYSFPKYGDALVVVDYLSLVPVVGLTGMVDPVRQGGEAAAELRTMSCRHGWAIICPAALQKESFGAGDTMESLWGDERVSYEADRILLVRQDGAKKECGCGNLIVNTLKDRTGPTRVWNLEFFGARFFVALNEEKHLHDFKGLPNLCRDISDAN